MKKIITFLFVASLLSVTHVQGQSKIGYIDLNQLIFSMPEFKSADTALAEYQNALSDKYAEMVTEFNDKDSILSSNDTAKLTRIQLELQRKDLGLLYLKIQGWNKQSQQLYNARENELLSPIQTKAQAALNAVAKENGYGYVFSRQALVVNPPTADDLAPLVKKKLGIN